MTAFGTIRALTQAGLRVPEDCSVIGFDDIAASSLYTPALSTVSQPLDEMGQLAVGLVSDGINAVLEKKPVPATHRKLTPRLVTRDSTAKPR